MECFGCGKEITEEEAQADGHFKEPMCEDCRNTIEGALVKSIREVNKERSE